jgi:hypothetical protein
MRIEARSRSAWVFAGIAASGALLSGCVGGPTYGTNKTSTEQLVTDVSGIMSLGPEKRPPIDYKPRPELVRPERGQAGELPAPQDSVVETAGSAWPESPEQRRARLRAEADANSGNPNYRSPIVPDMARAESQPRVRNATLSERGQESGIAPTGTLRNQREEFRRRRAESQQGSPTTRKYLSEPPLDYRQPSATAPTDELGEDEVKKERRRKAEARKKSGGRSFADLWPF